MYTRSLHLCIISAVLLLSLLITVDSTFQFVEKDSETIENENKNSEEDGFNLSDMVKMARQAVVDPINDVVAWEVGDVPVYARPFYYLAVLIGSIKGIILRPIVIILEVIWFTLKLAWFVATNGLSFFPTVFTINP